MRRTIGWFVAIAAVALLLPAASWSADLLAPKAKTAKVPIRQYRAATVGGFTDYANGITIAAGASDTTAPINMGRVAVVGTRLTGSGGENFGKVYITVTSSITFGVGLIAQASADGFTWADIGVISTVPASVGTQEMIPVSSNRAQGHDLSTFSDIVAFFPYVRFILDNSGGGENMVGTKVYFSYFSTQK